jgi:hypothetical protein
MSAFIGDPTGAVELAVETSLSVHGPFEDDSQGEIAIARSVMSDGVDRLDYLRKYRSYDLAAIETLETALVGLRSVMHQRVQTAKEFETAAYGEL